MCEINSFPQRIESVACFRCEWNHYRSQDMLFERIPIQGLRQKRLDPYEMK